MDPTHIHSSRRPPPTAGSKHRPQKRRARAPKKLLQRLSSRSPSTRGHTPSKRRPSPEFSSGSVTVYKAISRGPKISALPLSRQKSSECAPCENQMALPANPLQAHQLARQSSGIKRNLGMSCSFCSVDPVRLTSQCWPNLLIVESLCRSCESDCTAICKGNSL